MALALFDLDWTLLDVNSGRLWVRAEWRAGRLRLREVAWASWWLARYSLGFASGLDAVFEAAVQGLEGQSEAELEARVEAWFQAEVRRHLRPGARAALSRHRERGDRLVIATSGTTYAARAAAAAFGLDAFVSTELEVDEGRLFTGRIATLAVGAGKRLAVEAWAEREGERLDDATFYTDSYTDLALLERVAHPVAVHPDRKLRRVARARGWPIAHWGQSSAPTPPAGPSGSP